MCLDVGQTKAELWKHTSQHRKAALIKKQHVKATFSYFPMQCFTPKQGFKEGNSERKYALTLTEKWKVKALAFTLFQEIQKEMILLTLVFKK